MSWADQGAGRGPGRASRRVRRAWLLPILFGLGLVTWVGWLVAALGVRSRRRWAVAAVYAGLGAVIVIGLVADSSRGADVGGLRVAPWVLATALTVWVGGIVHAIAAAPQIERAWAARSTPSDPSSGASPSTGFLGLDTGRYYASSPSEAPANELERPDINLIGREALLDLEGIQADTADVLLAARERHGGFRDLRHLIAATGLPPHQVAALHRRIVFGTFRARSTERGSDAARGRVLDV